MSLAAVIAAALLAPLGPGADQGSIDTVLRLRTEFREELAGLREFQREWLLAQILQDRSWADAAGPGGPVIRQYRCDRHGVIEHGVIHANPELHPRPDTWHEPGIIDIGPDFGVLPDAPDDGYAPRP